MKLLTRLAAVLAPLALAATPALAQNMGQIASVKGGAHCAGCNLFQADLAGRSLAGRNLSQARLRQADLSLSTANRIKLGGADLRDVNAFGGVFSSGDFAGADLTNASFVGAHLEGANLRGATLGGVNFSGAEMSRAIGLTQGQLDGACGDAATRLPPGLRLPAC